MSAADPWKTLCLKLARHLRNTDNLPLPEYAVKAMNLLEEVHNLDKVAYDNSVKRPAQKEVDYGETDAGHDGTGAR